MSRMKEVIKFNNIDSYIKFNLSSGDNLLGYQQEIDNLTASKKEDLINPPVDYEVRRYSYAPIIQASSLKFYFYLNGVYLNLFTSAGFTTDEINNNSVKLFNSFFILDFYDTYDQYTQTKIFTTYLTKILGGNSKLPNYTINTSALNQLCYWHIPEYYLNQQTNTIFNAYVKFSFYNAKDGSISLFYNKDNNDDPIKRYTTERLYFKAELNIVNMTWRFITTSFPNILAYELIPTSKYVTRVNDTVINTENKKQVYPEGNSFQKETGTYTTE